MSMPAGFSPDHRFRAALLLLVAIAVAALVLPQLHLAWQLGLLCAASLALADLWLLRAQPKPQVTREVYANLPLGAPQRVRLRVRNPGRQTLSLRVADHAPADFAVSGMPAGLSLQGGQVAVVDYHTTPGARGDHQFDCTDVACGSPLGFWSRRHRVDNGQTVRVFPNFGELTHFALLARRNNLSAAGVRRRQRRGSGSDFNQLREYQHGDSLRQIDWKATGRYRKLISREYQDEQNQQLFFLLDCGQRMRHSGAGGQHLDAALNAMLLAAHVAVKQGDAVGYMTFAGDERYVAPRKGAGALPALLRSVYDIDSSTRAADYLRAADQFTAKHLRRALVVLITNTRGGDENDLILATRLLQTRHLVLVADMREAALDQAMDSDVADLPDAQRFHAANAVQASRSAMHEAMRHQGVTVVDILPEQLPLTLVNEYFEIKRAGRL